MASSSPNAAPRRRTARGEATEQRILDAAGECFAERGFRRARFEDIAKRAGVSRSLLYAYFDSKEDLLRSVRDCALDGWRVAVQPGIDAAITSREKLEAMIRETLRYARTRPFLQAILADDGRVVILGPEATSRDAIGAWRDRLIEILREGVQAAEFRQDLDVDHTADVLRAFQLGVIDRMHRADGPIDVSREQHIDAAVRLILEGTIR